MCSTSWLTVTYHAELIGFSISIFLNALLLKLISEKPKSAFGNYKYLMMSFSACGIFYSFCNFWSKPNVHITNTSFIVFTALKWSGFQKSFGSIAVTVYCSCYAMMLSLLSIHFFYRYTSVTAPTYLPIRFSLKSSAFWALFVALYSSVWGSASYFLCGPTENKDRELAEEFQRAYCLEPSSYAYVGPQYFYETPATGKSEFHLPSFLGIGVLAAQMSATFACVIWFGYKTYSTLSEDGITCFARKELQRQLFQTLVVQTIIPTVFMYLPVSCMFIFPMFGVRIEAMANLIPISVAIYPCLEPLVAMVLINDFRKRVHGLLNCRLRVNRISTLPTSNTWNSMYNAPN